MDYEEFFIFCILYVGLFLWHVKYSRSISKNVDFLKKEIQNLSDRIWSLEAKEKK